MVLGDLIFRAFWGSGLAMYLATAQAHIGKDSIRRMEMYCSLNSLKGAYIGDAIGDYYRGY